MSLGDSGLGRGLDNRGLDNSGLEVRGLGFAYGRRRVLDNLSFTLAPGEVLGLVGPNGAGKSTVIRLLTRLLVPSGGRVVVDGQGAARLPRRALARALAVVPQGGELPPDFRVYDLVLMGRAPHLGLLAAEGEEDHERAAAVMRRTDTWRYRDRLAGELSGGERQRVLLARALVQEPRYLLLDEPTSHLDLKYQAEVLSLTRLEVRRGLGALVVLHDLNLAARVCDRVLVLKDGRLVAEGPPDRVLTGELVERVYGTRADVFAQPETGRPVILPRL